MVSATISATLKTTRPVINPDIVNNFTDEPLPWDEAAAVLAYYLPLVDAESQVGSSQNEYLQARLHVSCAIGRPLGRQKFAAAAELGAEIWARRNNFDGDESMANWTMDMLFVEMSTDIDQLLHGAP